jgi:hypothetical protein
MKNRIFNLMAISLFMASSLNTYAAELSDCEKIGINLHHELLDAGLSHYDAYWWSGVIIRACEGS